MPAKIDIDKRKLELYLRLKPMVEDAAVFFKCDKRTIERFIRDEYNLSFKELRDQQMNHTRYALVQKAINMAMSGNTVLMIFCLKNLCGWSDNSSNSESAPIQLNYSVENAIEQKKIRDQLEKKRDEASSK